MARTLIRNVSGLPMMMPMPYGAVLQGGAGTIVEESVNEVIGYLGGVAAIKNIWDVMPANPASPLGPITSRTGGVSTARALAASTTPISFNGQRLEQVVAPVAPRDVANKDYVDASIAAALSNPSGDVNAGGDLSGTYPNPSVVRLRGRVVADISPTNGYGLTWDATIMSWKPAPPQLSAIPDASIPVSKLADSGAIAGTYGSANQIPVLSVDAKGRVTSASQVAIASPVMRVLSFDSGRVRVVAFGPAALLNVLSATKDFSADGVSTLVVTVPGLTEAGVVVIQHISATFLAEETTGRSALRVEMPAPAQGPNINPAPTNLALETRPLAYRLSQAQGVAHVGGSIEGLPFGRIRLEETGYTPATEQRVIVSF